MSKLENDSSETTGRSRYSSYGSNANKTQSLWSRYSAENSASSTPSTYDGTDSWAMRQIKSQSNYDPAYDSSPYIAPTPVSRETEQDAQQRNREFELPASRRSATPRQSLGRDTYVANQGRSAGRSSRGASSSTTVGGRESINGREALQEESARRQYAGVNRVSDRQEGRHTAHARYDEDAPKARGKDKGKAQYIPMDVQEKRRSSNKYSGIAEKRQRGGIMTPIIIGGAALALVIGVFLWWNSLPIVITVDGVRMEVPKTATPTYVYEQGAASVEPGDLYDVEGELLEEGGGNEFSVTINGEEDANPERTLSNGDELTYSDGKDTTEEYEVLEESAVAYTSYFKGTGPVYKVEQEGVDGTATVRQGLVSGKTAETVTTEPVDKIYRAYYPDVNGEKVICLTFDDGPWGDQTDELLDLLKKYDVKATFFCVGEMCEEYPDQLAREISEGHEVCTHTYDHAEGTGNGLSLIPMSAEEQITEVTKGFEAIETAGDTTLTSHIMRAPGGNFDMTVWLNIEDLIDANIGWDVDTEDWSLPGADAICTAIEGATSGDIVLMHDGGGDRSETIEALKTAIPYLQDKGYTFITISELLEYPAQDDSATLYTVASDGTLTEADSTATTE